MSRHLAAKALRRIERATGLDIERAWDRNPDAYDSLPTHRFAFVTTDGRRGFWNKKTGEYTFDAPTSPRDNPQKVHISFEIPIPCDDKGRSGASTD